MLSVPILKQRLLDAMQQGGQEDADMARDSMAQTMAEAIVEQIKLLKITYVGSLTAPNGPVAGTFTYTLS